MLIIAPIIIIIFILFAIDMIYFSDDATLQEKPKEPIIRESNDSKKMQDYFDKYINK